MRLAIPAIALAVIVVAACGGGAKQAAPPPAPAQNADSAEAARRRQQAMQDSIAREQARRDSAARAQAEADRMRRQRESDSLAALARDNDAVKSMIARAIHFDLDKSNLRSEDLPILDEKLRILQANPGLSIEIVGGADERGSDEYNLALGNRRAVAAKQYLTSRGIDASRVSTRSVGEEQPVDPGHTEEAWAKNRRDEFNPTAGANSLKRP